MTDREQIERIEELERRLEMAEAIIAGDGALITGLKSDIDALQADNARLRTAINRQPYTMDREVCEALAATPAQSLARLRNQVREECAVAGGPEDSYQDEWFKAKTDSAARIRAMKEPE